MAVPAYQAPCGPSDYGWRNGKPVGKVVLAVAIVLASVGFAQAQFQGLHCLYETSPGRGTIGVIEGERCVPALTVVMPGTNMEPIVRLVPGTSTAAMTVISCPKDFKPVIHQGAPACAREIAQPN